MKQMLLRLLGVVAALGVTAGLSQLAPYEFSFFEHSAEHELLFIFFEVAALFVLSFVVFYISSVVKLPSFVVAIFFGIAGHGILKPIIENEAILNSLVGFGATLILFGGGLETPFTNFKKLIGKILALSFIGLLFTAITFSGTVVVISKLFGSPVPIMVAVLLGAVLASTDPAAIIPVLKRLRFFNRSTKDIVVSESAVTDVTGTLLTVAFLGVAAAGKNFDSLRGWYASILTPESGLILLKQVIFGIIFGAIGYGFLEILQRFKKNHTHEFEADSAFFLFIPVVIFTIALAFGGSGYLAAFIAGLLFNLTEHLHETERFFNHIIDGFFKPTIFILLGALVDPRQLIEYAGIGILAAIIFMVVLRPVAVFLSLFPSLLFGKERLTVRDILFISCVRETGAIPAVLMITIASAGIGDIRGLAPIGMWVILLTLIIEPILTPLIAKKLKVAEEIGDAVKTDVGPSPIVVLGTRGRSFVGRLPMVAEWSKRHNIERLMVMLCLEDNYSLELAETIGKEAAVEFAKINRDLKDRGEGEIDFVFTARTGFLQENINELAATDTNVTAIFVGRKMLDFRLNEIKKLHVPLYFME
jgi:NhaP-type Na+/H+ or K+/H+ antiporter